MKHAVLGVVSAVIVVLVLCIIATVEGRHHREEELRTAVAYAVNSALAVTLESREGIPETDGELKALCTGILRKRLKYNEHRTKDNGYALEIRYLGCDIERGILSCHVKEVWTHPSGSTGSTEVTETAIREEDVPYRICTVTYRIPSENGGIRTYRRYVCEEGTKMPVPREPGTIQGKNFDYWTINGRKSELPETVEDDVVCAAVYK